MTATPHDSPLRAVRRALPLVLLAAAAAFAPARAAAQAPAGPAPSDTVRQVRRPDGSKEYGRVVEERGDTLVFETLDGRRLEAPRRSVQVRAVRGRVVQGTFWLEDRGGNRLFFAPTARTVRQGTGYAGAFWILPFVGYGVTDDVTVAVGWPSVVAPKVRLVDRPRVQVSAGGLTFRFPDLEGRDCTSGCRGGLPVAWHGVVYGVGTFGDADDALHAGAGAHFGDGATEVPVMLGGERRVSRLLKLVTENWIIPGEIALASAGMRRVGDGWTIDYGVVAVFGPNHGGVQFAPVLSYSYGF